LDNKTKNKLIELTATQCSQRKQDIEELVLANNQNNSEILTSQSLKYETEMLKGDGCFVEAPTIEFKNNCYIQLKNTIDNKQRFLFLLKFHFSRKINFITMFLI